MVDEYVLKACESSDDLRKLRSLVCGSPTLPPDEIEDAADARCIVKCVVNALNSCNGDVGISEDGWAVIGQLALTQREPIVSEVLVQSQTPNPTLTLTLRFMLASRHWTPDLRPRSIAQQRCGPSRVWTSTPTPSQHSSWWP